MFPEVVSKFSSAEPVPFMTISDPTAFKCIPEPVMALNPTTPSYEFPDVVSNLSACVRSILTPVGANSVNVPVLCCQRSLSD